MSESELSDGLRSIARLIRESIKTGSEPPRTVGRYQVYRQLGRGGQGCVLLAYDQALDREVILKERYPAGSDDAGAAEQLVEEGRVLSSIKSQYVATCYGVETQGDRSYLALEYIRGKSLQDEIARRQFTPPEAMELVAQIAVGLTEVHRARIVHGDLKPDNIIISDDGIPKLIDFGASTPPVDDDPPRQLGTAAYMAPERLHCPRQTDQRSDLFSLGVICFQLLTGSAPFTTGSKSAALEQISDGDVPVEKLHTGGIAPWMRQLCLDLLAASPDDRPQTAQRVTELIGEHLERRLWRHRYIFVAAALGLIAIAAAALVAVYRPDTTSTVSVEEQAQPPAELKELGLKRLCDAVAARQPLYEMPLVEDIDLTLSLPELFMDDGGYYIVRNGQELTVQLTGLKACYIAFYNVEFGPGKGPIKCELIYPSPGFESSELTPRYDPATGISFGITAEHSGTQSFVYAVGTDKAWDPSSLAEFYSDQQSAVPRNLRSDWRGFRRSNRFGEAVLPVKVLPGDTVDLAELTRQHQALVKEIAEQSGDVDREIQLRQQSLALLQQIDPTNHERAANELIEVARLHERKDNFKTGSALLHYSRQLTWPHASLDLCVFDRRLQALATLNREDLTAWKETRQVLEIAKKAFASEQWDLVEQNAQRALQQLERLPSEGLEEPNLWTNFLLGACALRRDELTEARHHMAQCKTQVERGEVDAVVWMQRIGHEFLLCGLPEEGEHWKGQAKTHLRSSSDMLESKLNQIRKQRSQGRYQQAQHATNDLLAGLKANELQLARAMEGLGDICFDEGSLQFAFYHYEQALANYKRVKGENCLEAARVNVGIARLLRDFGMYEQQRWHLDSALLFLDPNKRLFPKLYAMAIVQRGLYARDNWKLPDYGESNLKKGIDLLPEDERNHKNYGVPLLQLADLYLWQHRVDEAAAIYERYAAEAAKYGLDWPSHRVGLAEVAYANGDKSRATEIYASLVSDRCAALRRQRQSETPEALRANLQLVWHTLGRYLSTLDFDDPVHGRNAYKWLHEIRAIAKPVDTSSSAAFLAQQNEIRDLNAQISRLLVEPDARRVLDRFQPLWAQRGALERERRSRQEFESAETWQQVLARLPADAAVVDIVTFGMLPRGTEIRGRPSIERHVKAFIIRRDDSDAGYSLTCVGLGRGNDIEPKVKEWIARNAAGGGRGLHRAKTTSPAPAPVHVDLDRFLHERIWMRIKPHVSDCRTIVTLKSGQLESLPLGCIRNPDTKRFLIEDYAFVHLSSIFHVPRLASERHVGRTKLLAIGDLEFDAPPDDTPVSFRWQDLPESKSEMEEIAGLFPESSRLLMSGQIATRRNVLDNLQEADTVHFSTHGKFWGLQQYNDRRSVDFYIDLRNMQVLGLMKSTANLRHFLALSGANRARTSTPLNDFGLLSALEIRDLDLSHVDLVTLSACESASHQIPDGYSTLGGLPSAFINAGTRSVVGSLWLVEDKAAKAIMVEFYRNYQTHERPIGESLRAAQLAMIHGELNDELDIQGEEVPIGWWAPWVVYGDWR